MRMAKHPSPVEPFGEVVVERIANGYAVRATVLMIPDANSACTALAIDASASMQGVFGVKIGPFPSAKPNLVEPVARTLSAFLSNFSTDSKCTSIYWACGADGSAVEEIGRYSASEVEQVKFIGPRSNPWGKQTRLLSPVKYFVETVFRDSPWSIGVVITDGIIDDLTEVKSYCFEVGKAMSQGARQYFKLVLIGFGDQIDEAQMKQLDDMFVGSGLRMPDGATVDIWDHKIASEMSKLEEIFAEVVDENTIVVEKGRLLDNLNNVIKDYNNGVPAVLMFDLPSTATSFRLEWEGGGVVQDLTAVLANL